jgi:hypothetical protein
MMSCTTSSNPLPNAYGSAGEVFIVMSDYLWKGKLGDSVRHYLSDPVMGLPAPEPTFALQQQGQFTALMQKFRNILIVRIDPGYEMAKLGHKFDEYSKYQTIFYLDAPSADSAITCMYRNKNLIVSTFLLKDRDATINDYKRSVNKPVADKLRDKFQVDIVIPNPYTLDVEKDDFVWIAREEGERQWGILMWKEPYTSTDQLTNNSLINKMNAMIRNVTGHVAGSYMTEETLAPPVVKKFEKNGIYTVQMNGLWQMEKDFLGGPYVSHTIVDTQRGQLVTGYGFIFYPNRDKRQMVRQLEAILYTMTPEKL